jgi:hypothetical protein
MKTLILIGLLALVCSYPSFLRDLQSTDPVASHPDPFDFNKELFSPTGAWTLYYTSCVPPIDGQECYPTAEISYDDDSKTHVGITIRYPDDDDACGDYSRDVINYTANYYMGMYNNVDRGVYGDYRMNNKTLYVRHNDSLNNDGGSCYDYWKRDDSDDDYEPPTEKQWEGAWYVYKTIPYEEGKEDEYCCIPKDPVYVSQDLYSETIMMSYRAPDCESCYEYQNTIYAYNMSMVGGAGYDGRYYDMSSYAYYYEGYYIVQSYYCAYLYERLPDIQCTDTYTPPYSYPYKEGGGSGTNGSDTEESGPY